MLKTNCLVFSEAHLRRECWQERSVSLGHSRGASNGSLNRRRTVHDRRSSSRFCLAQVMLRTSVVRELSSILLVLLLSVTTPWRVCAQCRVAETPACPSSMNEKAAATRSVQPCHQASSGGNCCTPSASRSAANCQTTSADVFVPVGQSSPESTLGVVALLPQASLAATSSRLGAIVVGLHAPSPPVPIFLSLHSFLI